MLEHPVILFDGVCNFCNSSVNFVIRHDKQHQFRFAALQSEAGTRLLKAHGLSPDTFNSFILVQGDKAYLKSDAALRVVRSFGGGWRLLSALRFIPRGVRNFFYDLIARNRYRWFGKKDTCMLPSPSIRSLFLD